MANVHLYALLLPFAVGLWLIGVRIDGRPVARWMPLAVAVSLAAIATPMLGGAVRTAAYYGTCDVMVAGPVIAEMRPWGRDVASAVVLAAVLAGVAAARGRVPTGTLLWTAAAAALTLHLGRFAPVLAVAACPPLAVGLSSLSDRMLARRPVVVAVAAVLAAVVVRVAVAFPARGVPLSTWLNRLGPDAPSYPCAAADFVANGVRRRTGRLVNEFTWGGYLGWRLHDAGWRVLLDGRTQVFPTSLWRATYLGTAADRSAYLATVDADAAVLPVGHSQFRDVLLAQGWTTVYHDAVAEVLVPSSARRYTADPSMTAACR